MTYKIGFPVICSDSVCKILSETALTTLILFIGPVDRKRHPTCNFKQQKGVVDEYVGFKV